MTTNRLLLNINRNATAADRFMMQLTTGKRIHNPSDDPIIASRALRFRTNVAEVEQFRRNAGQATSWMEVTEGSMGNMQSILTNINTRLVQASTGTYTIGQRQTIAAEINMMFQQMNSEMNATFAGRYVFSGFRTDVPPIVVNDALPLDHDIHITKGANFTDIETLDQMFWRNALGDWEKFPEMGDAFQTHKLKLPYSRTDDRNMTLPVIFDSTGAALALPAIEAPVGVNPFWHAEVTNNIVFIPETGELIIPTARLADFEDGVTISYELDGLYEGELNPFIFFHTEELSAGPVGTAGNAIFTVGGQELRFELGTNVRIAINSQANDAYPWQLFANLMSLQNFVNSMEVPPNATEQEAIEYEEFFREALYQKFTNMISSMEGHIQHTATEYTTLGARMNRVELISNRLIENRDTFTELMSENENVDFIEVMMRFNAAEAIFQAAMQVGARIAQVSIVNFL